MLKVTVLKCQVAMPKGGIRFLSLKQTDVCVNEMKGKTFDYSGEASDFSIHKFHPQYILLLFFFFLFDILSFTSFVFDIYYLNGFFLSLLLHPFSLSLPINLAKITFLNSLFLIFLYSYCVLVSSPCLELTVGSKNRD